MGEIRTHRDAILHTVRRMIIAVAGAVVLAGGLVLLMLGTNFTATVPVGFVFKDGVVIAALVSAVLCAALTYRSGLLMLELSKAKAVVAELSRTDQLTGLLNRRGYLEAASAVLAQAQTDHGSVAVLMCDIDHFKAINDRYGHEFGDKILREIGETMRAFAGEHKALVARHGGEEFVALMFDVTGEQAIQRADALRKLCMTTTIINDQNHPAPVTVSVGIASSSEASSLEALIRAADGALYQAKRTGRNRVVQTSVAPMIDSSAATIVRFAPPVAPGDALPTMDRLPDYPGEPDALSAFRRRDGSTVN
jgi:diguanylate cyclase (GGDEF)-like protein